MKLFLIINITLFLSALYIDKLLKSYYKYKKEILSSTHKQTDAPADELIKEINQYNKEQTDAFNSVAKNLQEVLGIRNE